MNEMFDDPAQMESLIQTLTAAADELRDPILRAELQAISANLVEASKMEDPREGIPEIIPVMKAVEVRLYFLFASFNSLPISHI